MTEYRFDAHTQTIVDAVNAQRAAQTYRLLDLFAGAGGSAEGYHRAGWLLYGVESDPERAKAYPYPVHVGNALLVLSILVEGHAVDFVHPDGHVEWLYLTDFAAAHASPPCQGYTRGTVMLPDRLSRYDRLIAVTRDLLDETLLPYVIENVMGARPELRDPVMLCGRMFGLSATDTDGVLLTLDRHRLFEAHGFVLTAPVHHKHAKVQVAGVYGGARRDKVEARTIRKGGYVPKSLDVLRALLGVERMCEYDLFLSIPPAYTEHVGRQMLTAVQA